MDSRMQELLSDAYAAKLRGLAEKNAEKYRTAHPFPFIYFDDFLPEAAAEAALSDYPTRTRKSWRSTRSRSCRTATATCCCS